MHVFPRWFLRVVALGLIGAGTAAGGELLAQDILKDFKGGFSGAGPGGGAKVKFSGSFQLEPESRRGRLAIKAIIAPNWHIYSLTQPKGGPKPSTLTVEESAEFKLTGRFAPDREPAIHHDDVFPGIDMEEHTGTVVFSAPLELAEGVDPTQLALTILYKGQVCEMMSGCIPLTEKIAAPFAGYSEAPPSEYRAERSHATLRGRVEPKSVQPGGRIRVILTAELDSQWHIYALAERDPRTISKPTLIAISSPADWTIGKPQPSENPVEAPTDLPEEPVQRYHERSVSWTVEVEVPADAQPGEHALAGLIGYQTCTEGRCDPHTGAHFEASVTVGASAGGSQPLAFRPTDYALVSKSIEGSGAQQNPAAGSDESTPPGTESSLAAPVVVTGGQGQSSVGWILLLAFGGGLILNIMPCVLPVIGFKLLGFVEQAGESRARVFLLNVWYSVGVISVFMVLATLGVIAKSLTGQEFGWGQQFNYDSFNITVVVVLFVMALSLLGVWELPVPGFASGNKASQLAEKEGALGAVIKGIVTTIVATPCGAPLLGTAMALAWAMPWYVVYAAFFTMGLGLAAPYLLIGASMRLMKFLPKPGAWMDTVKKVMGFLLFMPAIFFFIFIKWENIVPTLGLLAAIGFACWIVGQTPIAADFSVRLRWWVGATALGASLGMFAFARELPIGSYSIPLPRGMVEERLESFLDRAVAKRLGATDSKQLVDGKPGDPSKLPWEPFSPTRLESLTRANQTVMIDFTAAWCYTCKVLEKNVLNTPEVRKIVDENKVTTLVADWSDDDPEITKLLRALGSSQVPVLAIYPAGRPGQPLVFHGGYTQANLLEKLQEAGPSRSAAEPKRTAMKID